MNSTGVSNVPRSAYNNSVSKNLKTIVHRPQSPRQFFERIYGHLENSSNNNVVDVNNMKPISPLASELSSSPDLIDRKHSLIDTSALESPLDMGFSMPHMGSMNFLTPGFNQFRPILGLSDHHLPAGLTAFLTSLRTILTQNSSVCRCKPSEFGSKVFSDYDHIVELKVTKPMDDPFNFSLVGKKGFDSILFPVLLCLYCLQTAA